MATHKMAMYQAQCDCCQYIETEYGEYTSWDRPDTAEEMACDYAGFEIIGSLLYCPNCFTENPETGDSEPHPPATHERPHHDETKTRNTRNN